MAESRWYLGTGTMFIRAQCKEYKTLEGAIKAAKKDESFTVWDEDGNMVYPQPEGTTEKVAEGAETALEDAKQIQAEKNTKEDAKAVNEAITKTQEDRTESREAGVIIPGGEMKVTVVCDGTLNLRRSPSWENGNECGRAARGQEYYVKEIHTIEGKKMIETIDGLYLSGDSTHVQFEQL